MVSGRRTSDQLTTPKPQHNDSYQTQKNMKTHHKPSTNLQTTNWTKNEPIMNHQQTSKQTPGEQIPPKCTVKFKKRTETKKYSCKRSLADQCLI